MKNCAKILCIAVFALALSGCSEMTDVTDGQEEYQQAQLAAEEPAEPTGSSEVQGDMYSFGGIGHPGLRKCYIHSEFFCGLGFPDHFVGAGIMTNYEFGAWAVPLREIRTSPHDECLVNIVIMIEHFGITREVFQQVVDDYWLDLRWHFNLDVIYSGDWDLINQYYSIDNEDYHRQLTREREVRHFSERFQIAQSIVDANNVGMSRYYHDIWTYVSFMENSISWFYSVWLHNLVATGQYERVNIVEFVDHFGLDRESTLSPGMSILEHWINEHNMHLYTHYNLDIIFSGDWELIRSYYSVENEHLHTAQVLAAYQAHYGRMPSREVSFVLGGQPGSPTTPNSIEPINILRGVYLLEYLAAHPAFPTAGPTRAGYEFAGWYLNADFTIPVTETFRMPARSTILYARWSSHTPSNSSSLGFFANLLVFCAIYVL